MEAKLDKLEKRIDLQEHYSRRKCSLIHGVPEKQNENTVNLAIKTFQEQIHIELMKEHVDRSYRLGKHNNTSRI